MLPALLPCRTNLRAETPRYNTFRSKIASETPLPASTEILERRNVFIEKYGFSIMFFVLLIFRKER